MKLVWVLEKFLTNFVQEFNFSCAFNGLQFPVSSSSWFVPSFAVFCLNIFIIVVLQIALNQLFLPFRSVAFWDLRNVKSMKSKLSSLHRTRVATSAYFSPQTGSQVLVTSLDDYVT